MSLPKNLLYQNKVDAMGARPYTSNIQPQGAQTYSANDKIQCHWMCCQKQCKSIKQLIGNISKLFGKPLKVIATKSLRKLIDGSC